MVILLNSKAKKQSPKHLMLLKKAKMIMTEMDWIYPKSGLGQTMGRADMSQIV
jgi:hypothetical protein